MTMLEADNFAPSNLRKVASGILGSEGPLVTRNGRLLLVEPETGAILEILPDGQKTELANTGGIPAGLQLHRDGSIWIADMKLGILKFDLDSGYISPVVTHFEGEPIKGCNDCAFDSQGNLYFTAPAGSSEFDASGEHFCRLSSGIVLRVDSGFLFCNGIAVSLDDRLLIVAETFTKRLYGYRLSSPGIAEEKFLFSTLPGDHCGGPDGIDFDAAGNLIVANWGGSHLEVFSPEGQLVRRVRLPFRDPSNLHFLGPDAPTLLITEHSENALWICDWPTVGQVQYGWLE